MTSLNIPADDLPPQQFTQQDQFLKRQLETAIARRFYEACDGITQALLIECEWHIVQEAEALVLVIVCPDQVTNWRVLNHVVLIANRLNNLSGQSRIRIYSPSGQSVPLEIWSDEISVYRDSL